MADPEKLSPEQKAKIDAALLLKFKELSDASKNLDASLKAEILGEGKLLRRAYKMATSEDPNYGSSAKILKAAMDKIKKSEPELADKYSDVVKVLEKCSKNFDLEPKKQVKPEKEAKPEPVVKGRKTPASADAINAQLDSIQKVVNLYDELERGSLSGKLDKAREFNQNGEYAKAAGAITELHQSLSKGAVDFDTSLRSEDGKIKEKLKELPATNKDNQEERKELLAKKALINQCMGKTTLICWQFRNLAGALIDKAAGRELESNIKQAGPVAGPMFDKLKDKIDGAGLGEFTQEAGKHADDGYHAAAAFHIYKMLERVNPGTFKEEVGQFFDNMVLRAADVGNFRPTENKGTSLPNRDVYQQALNAVADPTALLWRATDNQRTNVLQDKALATSFAKSKGDQSIA